MKEYKYPGNGKGFNSGKRPDKFGPDGEGEKNKVSGVSTPNKEPTEYNEKYKTPQEPPLNATSFPNKAKREVNKGIFGKISDNSISGVQRPNKIS